MVGSQLLERSFADPSLRGRTGPTVTTAHELENALAAFRCPAPVASNCDHCIGPVCPAFGLYYCGDARCSRALVPGGERFAHLLGDHGRSRFKRIAYITIDTEAWELFRRLERDAWRIEGREDEWLRQCER